MDNIRSQSEVDALYPPIDCDTNDNITDDSDDGDNSDDDDDLDLEDIDNKMEKVTINNFHKCPGCHCKIHISDYKKHIQRCL